MKNTILFSFLIATLLLISTSVNAQNFPKSDKSPMDASTFPISNKTSDKNIKIIYSRPELKKRSLEQLVPKGKVWRTGANEAPEITFYQDVAFGEERIPAGTYTFFIENNGDKWTGIISKNLNVWGSYTYDSSADIARLSVPIGTTEDDKHIEVFSIVFDDAAYGADMHLGWGKTVVSFPFKF